MTSIRKVAVIGCSIAGLSAALELLHQDRRFQVTLYDKKPFVGAHTICGGAISSFMLRELKMELPSHAVASEISSVRIHAPNGEYWQLNSEETYGYVLWREKFERYLAEKVLELGAEIRMNSEVHSLKELGTEVIIGADGLTGVTSKMIGFPDYSDIHIAVQKIAYAKSGHKNRIDLYFGRKVAPCGYAWVFTEGYKNQVRIGLGVPLSVKLNPKELLERFVRMVDVEPISEVRGKLIPTAKPPKDLIFGKVLLIGDAAHLCDPSTGGGIANAILSGRYAANAIVEGNLERYNHYCRGLKRRNLMRYRLKRILYGLSDDDFNEMVDAMKDFEPKFTRISWVMIHALSTLALKEPRLFTKHRVLRRLIGKSII